MAWMKQPLGDSLALIPRLRVHLQKPEANSIVSGVDNLDSGHDQSTALHNSHMPSSSLCVLRRVSHAEFTLSGFQTKGRL